MRYRERLLRLSQGRHCCGFVSQSREVMNAEKEALDLKFSLGSRRNFDEAVYAGGRMTLSENHEKQLNVRGLQSA